jgi:thiol-disulfide isomerase/thioredoxin
MRKVVYIFIIGLHFFSLQGFAAITPEQLNAFKQHHFLVLVYSAHCKFCQRFIPIVKQVEQQHHWPGVAFTIDSPSPLWPDVERLTNRLKESWFGQHVQVPALLLYSDSGVISFVSFGYLNQAALEKRLNIFIANLITHEASDA